MHASNIRKRKRNLGKSPKISLLNRQARWKCSEEILVLQSKAAWKLVSARRPARTRIYEEIECVLVTPSLSRQWHRDHFGDPTPTDVMTFPSPPLATVMVCPEVGRQQRHLEKLSHHEEILTYIIHGFLHLAGWNDLSDKEFSAMQKEQKRIRETVLYH